MVSTFGTSLAILSTLKRWSIRVSWNISVLVKSYENLNKKPHFIPHATQIKEKKIKWDRKDCVFIMHKYFTVTPRFNLRLLQYTCIMCEEEKITRI